MAVMTKYKMNTKHWRSIDAWSKDCSARHTLFFHSTGSITISTWMRGETINDTLYTRTSLEPSEAIEILKSFHESNLTISKSFQEDHKKNTRITRKMVDAC